MKVLMVGPGTDMVGGISSLADVLVPVLSRQVDLRYLTTVKGRAIQRSGILSTSNLVSAVSQYARFLFALWRFHPHLVHLHTSQGLGWLKDTFYVFAAKLHGCRVIVHVHAFDYAKLHGDWPPLVRRYTGFAMRLADVVIAVSPEWQSNLSQIVPAGRVVAFRNCIATGAPLARPAKRDATRIAGAFVGSIGPRKGVFDLIDALARLRQGGRSLAMWVAGYEERDGELVRARARVRELGLAGTCEVIGTVTPAERSELLTKADLFVLPTYHEGLPIAVLEAMAAGLPVVTTAVGGIPDVIRDGHNGFLVPPGDVDALADRLALLVDSPALREAMGRRNREFAESELDVDSYAERLVGLYESVACRPKRSVPMTRGLT